MKIHADKMSAKNQLQTLKSVNNLKYYKYLNSRKSFTKRYFFSCCSLKPDRLFTKKKVDKLEKKEKRIQG